MPASKSTSSFSSLLSSLICFFCAGFGVIFCSALGSGFSVGGSGSFTGLLSCSVSFIALKISVIKKFAAATAVIASENSGLFKILIPLA